MVANLPFSHIKNNILIKGNVFNDYNNKIRASRGTHQIYKKKRKPLEDILDLISLIV